MLKYLGLIVYLMVIPVYGLTTDDDHLLAQGISQLRQGQYLLAQNTLESAQKLAKTPVLQARVAGWLGLLRYRQRQTGQAEALLRKALETDTGDAREAARWMAALADIEAGRQSQEAAQKLYAEALRRAGGEPELATGIRLGQVALLPRESRLAALSEIAQNLEAIVPPEQRARFLLNIGTQAQRLEASGESLALASFEQARQISGSQARIRAEAYNGLAQVHEQRRRLSQAADFNQAGTLIAQSLDAKDLLFEFEWRAARLYQAEQRNDAALLAYQNAVAAIEAIRRDIPVEYHEGRSSFRETLEPVYLGLANMLLKQARGRSDEADLLRQARATIEMIKQLELEDFLGGRCAVESRKGVLLEAVEPHTAILYPIVLPDRLEILVSMGHELRHFSQPVEAETVKNTARRMATALRAALPTVNRFARQIDQWLIAPVESWLREHQVQTLVVVPDGVLRLIPLAALYDGEHYLIERYALATSPGLTLFGAAPLRAQGVQTLLAGMSEPGSVVEKLPLPFRQDLVEAAARSVAIAERPKSRALPTSLVETEESGVGQGRTNQEAGLASRAILQQLQEQLRLPGVEQEISSIGQQITNKTLMNQSFTVEGFKREVIGNPYSVVHIASHGVFGSTAGTSFIMAYDGIIDIDDLERLLKSDKFSREPLELLTLSACQTAEGDDRAPLGISGIAIKAKVRSTLGTLWPVADQAATTLMSDFYRALRQPGVSKAEALRQSQRTMLKDPQLAHPFFWAPFILVGNWL
jgi:CHAT domain-containing protein